MKKIATANAAGCVICHDITRIVKDVTKEVAFKKGHVVRPEDISALLALGKEHLYVWENRPGQLHENDAAHMLYGMCANTGLAPTPVKEGKIDVIAEIDGLYRVDAQRLNAINELADIIISSRHTNTPVRKGEKLAGMRVIPLVIDEGRIAEAKELAGSTPLLELLPYKPMKAAIVTTGSEVYYGRIKDSFTPVVSDKLTAYGVEVVSRCLVNDDTDKIAAAIRDARTNGADMIICTGGMSVDPDDLTPGAIKTCGADIVSYGAPVLPGAMFLLAYLDGAPVVGLPGCAMYARATIFDLILPRLVAGVPVSRRDITRMGHGGYCLNCGDCRFPHCGFGK